VQEALPKGVDWGWLEGGEGGGSSAGRRCLSIGYLTKKTTYEVKRDKKERKFRGDVLDEQSRSKPRWGGFKSTPGRSEMPREWESKERIER